MVCPWPLPVAAAVMIPARSTAMLAVPQWEMVMNGSLRQRGPSSWELRVYGGTAKSISR
jgi:hypothetical protein